ncbi:MAG TPA: ThiF family adenylyltransferase [Humisphaera sp.]
MDRYHRQSLLPQVGPAGQAKLANARVLLVGCGALGTTIAEQLVRAGVGFLRVVDRDVVELTNLQRQVLFDEADARDGTPKAVAAARRLSAVNSAVVVVEPVVADVHAGNIAELAGIGWHGSVPRTVSAHGVDRRDADHGLEYKTVPPNASAPDQPVHLILDGTDNAETRYLVNDLAVRHGVPWVYGACVGVEGRAMAIRPGHTPCLRCVFPEPPGPGELPTCDTAGVLGPAAAVVAATQAAMAIQLLVGATPPEQLVRFDLWRGRFGATPLDDARRPDCPCCGLRRFDFLDAPGGGAGAAVSLCGRNAVQIRPASANARLDLGVLAARLAASTGVQRSPHLLRCAVPGEPGVSLTVFADGRAIVQGVADFARARSVYAKWVGA